MSLSLQSEDIKSSRRMQGKRSLADLETCKLELKETLKKMFIAYDGAIGRANGFFANIPPESRARNFEPTVLQSCFADEVFQIFENNKAFYGKYKRLIVRSDGYLILFKKLNDKGLPMNIKTNNVQSILNQSMVLDLFADSDYNDEPILYFGYQKNRAGLYEKPQLIYIDEDRVKFTITKEDIGYTIPIVNQSNTLVSDEPKLKKEKVAKKA
ncbi:MULTISPECIES: hypothetical protein [Elizabethkingia]|uniref:hypothetical protein n=1 Tax=Elizabethkingia TaxID=308865 RepID=UPI001627544D|nr:MULTISPECIES: hypothetical protein [Elizabethkingia]MDX8576820.1 hypothetical protein [Elizabethkingia sp. HX WYD]HCZ8396919.1 hypothetical protein [Elizabethkingia anophelis]